jgi:serine/threonine-protein kinase
VLDFGIDDEMPYIAMELLQGESLADRLKREARIPLPDAAKILGQVCKALRTAHDEGLVHRDLKPGNIFLAVKDGEEVVKVLDFGIVKETSRNDADDVAGATETGVMMGSVHYMSPEQIRSSRQVDHRSDLWSVAVILYKMLTGNAPFPGTTTGDVMVRVCTDSCQPPSSVVP